MSVDGLEIIDLKISGGPSVADGDAIILMYKVALSEEKLKAGELLESTYGPDIPREVKVVESELLSGVYRALLGMKAGGSIRQVKIPSNLAYGSRGSLLVPADMPIVVELCVARIVNRPVA